MKIQKLPIKSTIGRITFCGFTVICVIEFTKCVVDLKFDETAHTGHQTTQVYNTSKNCSYNRTNAGKIYRNNQWYTHLVELCILFLVLSLYELCSSLNVLLTWYLTTQYTQDTTQQRAEGSPGSSVGRALDLWLEDCRFESGIGRSMWDYFHIVCSMCRPCLSE